MGSVGTRQTRFIRARSYRAPGPTGDTLVFASDPFTRQAMAQLLAARGHRVHVRDTPDEAFLALFDAVDVRRVVLDPLRDGVSFARFLKEAMPRIRRIALVRGHGMRAEDVARIGFAVFEELAILP